MSHLSNSLHRIGLLVTGLAALALWASFMVCMLRSRSALLDLLEEVNGRLPYVTRYNPYTMNPLTPFRVWRRHREFFPQDTGARRRVKRYSTASMAALVACAALTLVLVLGGR